MQPENRKDLEMPRQQGSPGIEARGESGKRFVLWFFVVGTIVPVVLTCIGFGLGLDAWSPNGVLAGILEVFIWIVWPTAVFMMDAEHLDQVLFMLPIAAVVNGAWYSVVGVLVWHLRKLVWPRRG